MSGHTLPLYILLSVTVVSLTSTSPLGSPDTLGFPPPCTESDPGPHHHLILDCGLSIHPHSVPFSILITRLSTLSVTCPISVTVLHRTYSCNRLQTTPTRPGVLPPVTTLFSPPVPTGDLWKGRSKRESRGEKRPEVPRGD